MTEAVKIHEHKTPTTIEYIDSSFNTHEFQDQIFGTNVTFQTLRMTDSTFIWIGDSNQQQLIDLSVAIGMNSKDNGKTLQHSTNSTQILTKDMANCKSKDIALKLSVKLKKPVYVSLNIEDDRLTTQAVERLLSEINDKPDKF